MGLWQIYHEDIPAFLQAAADTPPMQRLKGVGMNCGCEYTSFPLFALWQPYSRFGHSVGAALITWHFTHDPHQAMAALLHDIATPVFSHVVDFLRGDHEKQESTECGTAEIILNSPHLQAVFGQYGIDGNLVTDYHIYPIADNDSPRLSADRLEYTLGNIVNFGFGTEETVKKYYDDLMATKDELVFRSPEIAVAFARDALRCGRIYVSDADRYCMQTLADLLKKAVGEGRVTETDFYGTEDAVIKKLDPADWERYCALHALARNPQGLVIPAKKRYIDPCTTGGARASQIDPLFGEELAAFLDYRFDYGLVAVK